MFEKNWELFWLNLISGGRLSSSPDGFGENFIRWGPILDPLFKYYLSFLCPVLTLEVWIRVLSAILVLISPFEFFDFKSVGFSSLWVSDSNLWYWLAYIRTSISLPSPLFMIEERGDPSLSMFLMLIGSLRIWFWIIPLVFPVWLPVNAFDNVSA